MAAVTPGITSLHNLEEELAGERKKSLSQKPLLLAGTRSPELQGKLGKQEKSLPRRKELRMPVENQAVSATSCCPLK